jgi:indolepyruvate ferredoxin oxidoreductase beta subunit
MGNAANILVVGVGGQGILLASRIMAETFTKAGYDVKMSCTLGMSQRGGSVCSHIRIGEKIYSPLIPEGEADILVGMELLEVSRWLKYLKRQTSIILLDREIYPNTVNSKIHKYPKDLKDEIQKCCKKFLTISYNEIANDLRDIKTANMFMLGILSNRFLIKKKYWLEAIKEEVPPRMKNLNLGAFELGRKKFSKNRLDL